MRNSCAHNTRFSPFSSANVIALLDVLRMYISTISCIESETGYIEMQRMNASNQDDFGNQVFHAFKFFQERNSLHTVLQPIPPTRSISSRIWQRNYIS